MIHHACIKLYAGAGAWVNCKLETIHHKDTKGTKERKEKRKGGLFFLDLFFVPLW
jgi:hypothetical protein